MVAGQSRQLAGKSGEQREAASIGAQPLPEVASEDGQSGSLCGDGACQCTDDRFWCDTHMEIARDTDAWRHAPPFLRIFAARRMEVSLSHPALHPARGDVAPPRSA